MFERKNISGYTLGRLWRAFIAGAGVFGAEMPRALASVSMPKSEDPEEWISFALVAIHTVTEARGVDHDEITPAGFRIDMVPGSFRVAFGSGRTEIGLVVPMHGLAPVVEIGLTQWATGALLADALSDPDGAQQSINTRYIAALDALVGVPDTHANGLE